jgi:hypothetical protein
VPPPIVYRAPSQIVRLLDDTLYDDDSCRDYDIDFGSLRLVTREQLTLAHQIRQAQVFQSY